MAYDPHGKTSLKLDVLDPLLQSGKVFYVNNSGVGPEGMAPASNSSYGESPLYPMSTIAAAMDRCVANRGDKIIVFPGHSETLTAQLDFDVAGVSVIGVGNGLLRPKLIVNGAIDLIDVSAANMLLQNFQMEIVTTDAATAMVNIDAAGFTMRDIRMIPSSGTENVVDCIVLTANADDCLLEDILILNKVVAVVSFIHFEGAASNVRLRRVNAFGDCSTAGIIDTAKIDYLLMEDCNIATVGTTIPAAILDSNPEGMIVRCNFAGTSATLADNAALGNLVRMFDVKVLEETDGSKQGANIPAVDAD